jgi:hypothetical protein
MIELKDKRGLFKKPRQVINKINFIIDNRNIYPSYEGCFNKSLDYILDINQRLHIGLSHYYLIKNAPTVLGAGSLKINKSGKVYYIDNKSGHYQPTKEQFNQSIILLNENIDLTLCDTSMLSWKNEEDRELYYKGCLENKDNDSSFSKYLKPYSLAQFKKVTSINNFNSERYLKLNPDIERVSKAMFPNDLEKQILYAKSHFYLHGQYEDGRFV